MSIKIIDFLAKLSLCLIIMIMIEGFFTLGGAFKVENYNIAGVIVQVCLFIICVRISLDDWK